MTLIILVMIDVFLLYSIPPPATSRRFPILYYAKHSFDSIMKKTKNRKQQRKRNRN